MCVFDLAGYEPLGHGAAEPAISAEMVRSIEAISHQAPFGSPRRLVHSYAPAWTDMSQSYKGRTADEAICQSKSFKGLVMPFECFEATTKNLVEPTTFRTLGWVWRLN